MASKSAHQTEPSNSDIEDLLDVADKTLDRVKVLYEQYFLGIQKQPPTHLHHDIERKLRDLAQIQIRNTALRYRFAMMQQKFGSYHSYWRRTLRQIENGTYSRNLQKIGRAAVRSGEEIPEEILAAMPKRMRDQIRRDREAALALAARRRGDAGETGSIEELDLDAASIDDLDPPTELKRPADKKTSTGAHILSEDDGNLDIDAFFAEVQAGTIPPPIQTVATRLTTQAIPTVTTPKPVAPPPPKPPADLDLSSIMPDELEGDAASTRPAARFVPPLAAPRTPPARPASTTNAPSQVTRPNPIAPGAAARVGTQRVETMSGPFPREAKPDATPDAPNVTTTLPIAPLRLPATMKSSGLPPRPQTPTTIPSIPKRPTDQTPPIPKPGSATGQTTAIPKVGSSTGPAPAIPKVESSTEQTTAIPKVGSSTGQTTAIPKAPPPTPQTRPQVPTRTATPPAGIPTRTATPPAGVPARTAPPAGASTRTATPPAGVPVRTATPAAGVPTNAARAARPDGGNTKPPPGMTDAEVNTLYTKYIQAKQSVGEQTGPAAYAKLLKTINQQAPKIMEQYNAKGVDFSVVVKDNQVIIRAKPKT